MQTLTNILFAVFHLAPLIAWLYSFSRVTKRHLHILQLEDYQPGRMIAMTGRTWLRSLAGFELLGLVMLAVAVYAYRMDDSRLPTTAFLPYIWFYGIVVWTIVCWRRGAAINGLLRAAKKPLVMTPRAKRLFWSAVGLGVVGTTAVFYLYTQLWSTAETERFADVVGLRHRYLQLLFAAFLVERTAPLVLSAAAGLLLPFESLIRRRYLTDARRILDELKPLVIGVTGSYGKTGTKEILAALLGSKFNVLRPPGSYNTLMGITRVIREELRPFHEVMVVEMGAFRVGSIARLCALTKPRHGIITVIGVQHLERFKSRDAIRRAKGELIRALPPDGIAVLNGDDPLCREIGREFAGQVVYFSLAGNRSQPPPPEPVLRAADIEIAAQGSRFKLIFPDGEAFEVRLPLLGRGAVANAAASAALADRMGIPRREIVRTLAAVPQVRHRLERLPREDGVIIIDDAYNSNPVGAAAALEVLAQATHGRRVLVTPGFIELGPIERQANYDFGRQAAGACDMVVLVGSRRVEPIRRGLLDAGFPPEAVRVVATLKEGLHLLDEYLQPGDTMLLENDLPDQYDRR